MSQFGMFGSQPIFEELDAFYKQLSATELLQQMEETQTCSYRKKINWLWLNFFSNYNFCNLKLSGIRCEANIFGEICFIKNAADCDLGRKNQTASFGWTSFWLYKKHANSLHV